MATGTTFVHDFAGVDRPASDVLAAVPCVLDADSVRDLVLRAWEHEATALLGAGSAGVGVDVGRGALIGVGAADDAVDDILAFVDHAGPGASPSPSSGAEQNMLALVMANAGRMLLVDSGPPRVQRESTVVPVSWSGAEQVGLPPLDSDVEFTSFGDDRTHVHLYGRSAVSAVAPAGSRRANLTSRVAVALVRRFLGELAAELDRAAAMSSPATVRR